MSVEVVFLAGGLLITLLVMSLRMCYFSMKYRNEITSKVVSIPFLIKCCCSGNIYAVTLHFLMNSPEQTMVYKVLELFWCIPEEKRKN